MKTKSKIIGSVAGGLVAVTALSGFAVSGGALGGFNTLTINPVTSASQSGAFTQVAVSDITGATTIGATSTSTVAGTTTDLSGVLPDFTPSATGVNKFVLNTNNATYGQKEFVTLNNVVVRDASNNVVNDPTARAAVLGYINMTIESSVDGGANTDAVASNTLANLENQTFAVPTTGGGSPATLNAGASSTLKFTGSTGAIDGAYMGYSISLNGVISMDAA